MRTLKVNDFHSDKQISEKITSINNYNDVVDWKIIQCVKSNIGINANDIARFFCISIQKVYKVIQDYNKQGTGYKSGVQWGGRRKETSFLSLDEERKFLENMAQKARKGEIITAKDIKSEIENTIGHEVSNDYIWRLFKRHNWTKKSVRPHHPKTDYTKQEEFKKNYIITWQPPE